MSLELEIVPGPAPFDSALIAARAVAQVRGDLEVAALRADCLNKEMREKELGVHTYPLARLYRDGVLVARSDVMFWTSDRLGRWIAANSQNGPLVWPPLPSGDRPVFRDYVITQPVRSRVRRHGVAALGRETRHLSALAQLLARIGVHAAGRFNGGGSAPGLQSFQLRVSPHPPSATAPLILWRPLLVYFVSTPSIFTRWLAGNLAAALLVKAQLLALNLERAVGIVPA